IVSVKTLDASITRIRQNLEEKLPELIESFDEFMKLVRNEDVSLPRFWEEAPFGLVDIKDEEIINLVPMNCRQDGQVKIVQTIIRLNPAKVGTEKYKLIYKYVPHLFQDLYTADPLQLSFLLVHEWLWDLSHNVEKNRRLNRVFHSKELETLNREQLRIKLTTLGLEIPPKVSPEDFRYDSCPADPNAAQALMSKITQRDPVILSQHLTFKRRNLSCPFDGVDSCLHSRVSFSNDNIGSFTNLSGILDEHGEKYLYFESNFTSGRACTVNEADATIRCSAMGGRPNYNSFDWFLPTGTVGNGCIRLYDSKFTPGYLTKGVPSDGLLDELVLAIKF
ncbi:MAG: hypothetical protein ACXVCE_14125, partial [Bacteriovorax sp.]